MLFQKLSRKGPLLQFLNDHDHFFGQKFDMIILLFSVSHKWPRAPGMVMYDCKETTTIIA